MRHKKNSDQPASFRRHHNPITWLLRHLQVLLASLGRLSRHPLNSFMTIAVIGIAIALPTGLHTLVDSVKTVSGSWQGAASISAFLHPDTPEPKAEALVKHLRLRTDIDRVTYISREQAMDEFRKLSGFGEALDLLEDNPLPPVVLIFPAADHASPELTAKLAKEIEKQPDIHMAQADLEWVRRLEAMTKIIERGVLVLAVLLSTAVLLIIGNTIRLEIQNRQHEIEISKLVGGTNAFIRRPFLYDGFWYGLIGGFIAWLLVTFSLLLLQGPVARLAGLYQSTYALSSVSAAGFLLVLGGSALLGLAGAWLAVGKHLSEIEPG